MVLLTRGQQRRDCKARQRRSNVDATSVYPAPCGALASRTHTAPHKTHP